MGNTYKHIKLQCPWKCCGFLWTGTCRTPSVFSACADHRRLIVLSDLRIYRYILDHRHVNEPENTQQNWFFLNTSLVSCDRAIYESWYRIGTHVFCVSEILNVIFLHRATPIIVLYSNNVNISLEGEIENQLQNDVTRFQLLHNITTNDRWLINTNIRGFEIGPY